MKQIINITDITAYLYCPRKLYLKLVKGVKEPPNQKMILGMLRHQAMDIFNRNEEVLVSGIKEKIPESEINRLYKNLAGKIITKITEDNKTLLLKFEISKNELEKSINKTIEPETALRVIAVGQTLEQGFLGSELWYNLKPKYLTEHKIESGELGLKGRIDRVVLGENIIPVEIKTREGIFESDFLQLAGYALLLEKEFSRAIDNGIVELLGKQEEVKITPEHKTRVLEIAEKIRNLKEETASFPSNFQKCESCSLKEICNE